MTGPRADARRVHVAGRGVVSGFGAGRRRLVDAVRAGHSAVRARARTAAFRVPEGVAAEVPLDVLAAREHGDPLPLVMARLAAREALEEAGGPDPSTIGLVLASTKADLSGIEGSGAGLAAPHRLAEHLARDLGLVGTCVAVSTACASGLVALALAARRIARGEERRLLVVGVDALYEFIVAGFGGMHALDPDPCRPFDATRRGINLGEGAAALLLSSEPDDSLGVTVAGHGGANDASHETRPDAAGHGLALAVSRALACAHIAARDVDVVHVHGTGTAANDAAEARGLAHAFGGPTPPAFGTKAQTGHTLGAAGVLETLLIVDALQRGRVPANARLERPDVDPRLDLVRRPRALPRARVGLKVASGFAGIQAALVLEA